MPRSYVSLLISLVGGSALLIGCSSAELTMPGDSLEATVVVEPPATIAASELPALESSLRNLTGTLDFEVVATYPHDQEAFTQGLEINGGVLYESTGLYGESDRRAVDLITGNVLDREPLPDEVFGEGMTVVDHEIFQLTWKSGLVFVSDLATLDELRVLPFDAEGWGLCYDGTSLVSSDGSAVLSFRDPSDLSTKSTITVTNNGQPLERLNELECVDDLVVANVYQTASIVIIDPSNGTVRAALDLTSLVPAVVGDPDDDVLNGIAYRPDSETFLITGKRWDTIYELRLLPA